MSVVSEFLENKVSTNAAYGIIVLMLLAGLVAMSSVRGRVNQIKVDTQYASRELAKLNSIQKSDVWANRVRNSTVALEEWQGAKWQGETVGVLAAKIQQKLIRLAAQLDMRNPQINVSNELLEINNAPIMRFSLSGSFNDKTAAIELLLTLAKNEKTILIDDINVDFFQGNNSIMRLTGIALVQIGKDEEEQGQQNG